MIWNMSQNILKRIQRKINRLRIEKDKNNNKLAFAKTKSFSILIIISYLVQDQIENFWQNFTLLQSLLLPDEVSIFLFSNLPSLPSTHLLFLAFKSIHQATRKGSHFLLLCLFFHIYVDKTCKNTSTLSLSPVQSINSFDLKILWVFQFI